MWLPVSEQVGFPTILLDSKCFALMKNDATSGIEFWKSTRKILAASASLWQQVSGHNIGTKLSVQVQGNADVHEDAGPAPKKQRLDNSETCQTVLEKVSKLEEKFTFLDELAQSLTCAICKTVSTLPVIFPCCQRVVGCESCINSWLAGQSRCPLCNTSDKISGLKGFDQVLSVAHIFHTEAEPPTQQSTSNERIDHMNYDSDFEELPQFSRFIPDN